MLYSSFVIISLLSQIASTRFITIQNSGFELDLSDYQYGTNSYDYGPIQNWDHYDPKNIMNDFINGISNPTGGTLYNDPLFGDSAPEGTLVTYLASDELKGGDEFGLYQTLTGNVVTVNTTYTLSVWVGNPATNTYSKNSRDEDLSYDEAGSQPYTIQLVSDDMVLAQDDNTLSIDEGQWKQSIVSVDILNGNPHIGKTLSIRLLCTNADTSNLLSIDFDDVRLEALQTISSLHSLAPTTSSTNSNSLSTLSPTATAATISATITSNILSTIDTTHSSRRSSVLQTNSSIVSSTTTPPKFTLLITTTATPPEFTSLITTTVTPPKFEYETSKPELTEVMVTSKIYVDWLAIALATVSIVVCLVIMIIVVCFIKERNQLIKRKEAENMIRRHTSDIEVGFSVTTNDGTIGVETDVPSLPGSFETSGYNANIAPISLYEMGKGASNDVYVPSKQLAQAIFDAMQQDEMPLEVLSTAGGNAMHNKKGMGMIDMNNEENDKDTDSESEGLWEPGKTSVYVEKHRF